MGKVMSPSRHSDNSSGMLYIDVPSMSLNRHYGSEGSQHIISDLRGCQVDKVNEEGRIVLVIRAASNTVDVTLRPPIPDVEKWFAALYRWRSVSRSASNHSLKSLDSTKVSISKMNLTLQSTSPPAPRTPSTPRPILDIKIGSMLLLPNRRVKAILKDSGLLSILSEAVLGPYLASNSRPSEEMTNNYYTASIYILSSDPQFN